MDGALMRNSPSVRQIGFETEDPAGYAGGLRTCRGSDAATYSYSAGLAGQVGLIARLNPGGSLQWNQSTPFWTISAAAPTNMFVGLSISKTGMITGWTSGQITHTCNDYFSSGTRTRTCQNDANVYLKKGDSGGPVFFENGMGSGYVTLAGITSAIGGWPNNNMIFSSFARVAQNLAIDAYDVIHPSLFPAQPVVTGSLSGNNPVLTWPSVPSAVSYRLLRQWYRYSNEQGSNGFEDMGNVTSLFSGDFLIVDAYTGTTIPNFSTEGYAAYQLIAYNSNGTPSRTSVMKYFRLAP
ncbi:trypsin-like serine protease [Gemmatimonas sp.]|uniref:trypsin-like serine protease n=1 Tax=Gemmatimonas sp. TaxID=1962908 RepID=UPI00356882BD